MDILVYSPIWSQPKTQLCLVQKLEKTHLCSVVLQEFPAVEEPLEVRCVGPASHTSIAVKRGAGASILILLAAKMLHVFSSGKREGLLCQKKTTRGKSLKCVTTVK